MPFKHFPLRIRTLDEAGHPGCVVGIHTHDDAGLAVAGALAAVEAEARQVQGYRAPREPARPATARND